MPLAYQYVGIGTIRFPRAAEHQADDFISRLILGHGA